MDFDDVACSIPSLVWIVDVYARLYVTLAHLDLDLEEQGLGLLARTGVPHRRVPSSIRRALRRGLTSPSQFTSLWRRVRPVHEETRRALPVGLVALCPLFHEHLEGWEAGAIALDGAILSVVDIWLAPSLDGAEFLQFNWTTVRANEGLL